MEWRKNLYDYEGAPPNDTWGKISQELDSDVPAIREALFDYAEEPPIRNWSSIEAKLIEPKVVPLYKYRKALAYTGAAAAVLAGIMFFSNLTSNGKKDLTPDLSASVFKPVEPKMSVPETVDKSADSVIVSKKAQVQVEEPPKTAEIKQPDPRNETRRTLASIQPVQFDPEDENYIYLTSSNGEVKRVSYKFEDMLPEIQKQNSELIRKWREKLESSSFVPAGSNFFDIAEMIRILQEEKRP